MSELKKKKSLLVYCKYKQNITIKKIKKHILDPYYL